MLYRVELVRQDLRQFYFLGYKKFRSWKRFETL